MLEEVGGLPLTLRSDCGTMCTKEDVVKWITFIPLMNIYYSLREGKIQLQNNYTPRENFLIVVGLGVVGFVGFLIYKKLTGDNQ